MNEKEAVRLYVRKAIQLYKENKRKEEVLEETKLRQLVRGLILKEVAEDQGFDLERELGLIKENEDSDVKVHVVPKLNVEQMNVIRNLLNTK